MDKIINKDNFYLSYDVIGVVISFIHYDELVSFTNVSDVIKKLIFNRYPKTRVRISTIQEGKKYNNLSKNLKLILSQNNNFTNTSLFWTSNIVQINLGQNRKITNKGLEYVAKTLEVLFLWNNNTIITNEGLKKLVNLKILVLQNNNTITDEGLINLTKLEYLLINENTIITDKGLSHLPQLKKLNIDSFSQITDDGLSYLNELEILDIQENTNISIVAINKLKKLKEIHICHSIFDSKDNKITKEFLDDCINKNITIKYN